MHDNDEALPRRPMFAGSETGRGMGAENFAFRKGLHMRLIGLHVIDALAIFAVVVMVTTLSWSHLLRPRTATPSSLY